ncbi:DUF305 domain-containing protein [Rhizobium sp. SGZ-381]|uniref:CopM family metallochaperone n=1 Tax=Rhizobium sp. SGZ-381 TaxID=3342800 RepID=UPI00366CB290
MITRLLNARLIPAALAAALAFTAPILSIASAQDMPAHAGHGEMKGSMMSQVPKAADTASTRAFEAANRKMHTDMAVTYTGDADVDFVRSMIPHHQGAIDMARVELEHGKDPKIRALAQDVIKAQEAEIAEMKAWLKSHGR